MRILTVAVLHSVHIFFNIAADSILTATRLTIDGKYFISLLRTLTDSSRLDSKHLQINSYVT